jgi:hypothetical protein
LHCTAVGESNATSNPRAFILHTTNGGASWQLPTTPVAAGPVVLGGVRCESPTQCTAVGHQRNGPLSLAFKAAILRTTDGLSWTSPNPGSERAGRDLAGLACTGDTACTAVGRLHPSGSFDFPVRALVLDET